MPKAIAESATLTEATASTDRDSGLLDVVFLTPGWGSSGYYSTDVVEAAAPLFAAGTHMYFDHPTADEAATRPGRSVRDLCAVIKESGTYDAEAGGIRGKVKPFAPYRDLLLDEDFAGNIGLSIRGSATDMVVGEAEGRSGNLVEGLADITSVDFVTRAGRGGRVLSVMESARPEQVVDRAVARGLEEATADERRQQLSDAVRTAYAGNDRYAWVQDFDETTVWFQASLEAERSRTWQQTYAIASDDMSVALTGERVEVRPTTKYVPVTRPDSTNPTTTESQEDNMGKIQIEEAEHTRLTETAGRVTALQEENATLKADKARLEEAGAVRDRRDRATTLLAERAATAEVTFTVLESRGLLADLPVKDGALDEPTFTKAVDEAAAEKKVAGGAGTVTGFGGTAVAESGGLSWDDIDNIGKEA